MSTITERMKKYEEHYPSDLEPDEHNIFTDLQATVQALEVARKALGVLSRNNISDDIAPRALKTIDSVLGEKK
jgi:hypothetical protein